MIVITRIGALLLVAIKLQTKLIKHIDEPHELHSTKLSIDEREKKINFDDAC
jgi:hypothetical protein